MTSGAQQSFRRDAPRSSFHVVLAMLGMVVVPAAITLHTVRGPAFPGGVLPSGRELSPYGYTVSLLLFIVPIFTIGLWLAPREEIKISKKSFARTILLLFPLGAGLDFFFAHKFFTFPNRGATLGILFPALGGGVPVEEYVFYFTGFVAVLLLYIWLDEYWLAAYGVSADAKERGQFDRLLRFHPASLVFAAMLIAGAIAYRKFFVAEPGFPGYFIVLVAGALGPSAALLPAAMPVINWRALSLAMFIILLTSLMWEVSLALPYGWWNFQDAEMIGVRITAWSGLPIEEVFIWVGVTYSTVIVYEVVRRWKASRKKIMHALVG